jgi:hypothetical protein
LPLKGYFKSNKIQHFNFQFHGPESTRESRLQIFLDLIISV